MANLTITGSGLFKPVWPTKVALRALARSWFFQAMSHDDKWGGSEKYTDVRVTAGNGASADFYTASANRRAGTYARFTSSPKPWYVVASVDGALKRRGNAQTLRDALEFEIQQKLGVFFEGLDRRVLGENGGALGRLPSSSAISGTGFYVRTRGQAYRFHPGQRLTFSTDDGASANPTGNLVGSVEVSSVDVATKLVTCTGNVTDGIPSADVSNYVWLEGEYGLIAPGVLSWVPPSDPDSTTFQGVDRTAYGDLYRLSGYRPSSASRAPDYETTIRNGLAEMSVSSAKPTNIIVSATEWNTLQSQIGSKLIYTTQNSALDPTVGFTGLTLITALGQLSVYADPRMIDEYWLATDPKAWVLHTTGLPAGGAPAWKEEAAADALQCRIITDYCITPQDARDPGESAIGAL